MTKISAIDRIHGDALVTDFTPAPQQRKAIKAIKKWFKNDSSAQPFFYLGGLAGCGKTSIAKFIAEDIGGDVLFAAYTGKAALVMRSKGCVGASTIHSLIYKPLVDEETGKVRFVLDTFSRLHNADLVIIDECSMVDDQIAAHLMSFGTPILVLGDPAQLPPVAGAGFFTSGEPDFMLTDIHRQAQDNPIIHLAMKVRAKESIKPGTYGESRVVRQSAMTDDIIMEDHEQTICGLNKTRRALNALAREGRGFTEDLPVVGDRLVCTKNNRNIGLLNGSLWDVHKLTRRTSDTIEFIAKTADTLYRPEVVGVKSHLAFFEGKEKDLKPHMRKQFQEFDFGYALTAHKAQGSTFESCMIIDESYVFRDDRYRWLYTAITRASDRITLLID